MKYIEPILFPITVNPIKVLKFAGEHNLQDFDVLINYGYQKIHYELFYKYVDPDLMDKMIQENPILSEYDFHGEPSFLIDKILTPLNTSVYKEYYKLFLINYMINNMKHTYQTNDFYNYLKEKHDFTFKKCFTYRAINRIDNYYNTIIFLDFWDKKFMNIYSAINRLYGLLPISLDQEEVIFNAGEHLIDGGRLYNFSSENFGKLLFALGDNFDVNNSKVLLKKNDAPKEPKKKQINWL